MKKLIKGRYEIVKPIKTGGFATVYLARDKGLDMDVVLKKFHKAEVAGKLKGIEKATKYSVEQEIKKAIRLDHPNIARYYDYFTLHEDDVFEKHEYEIGVMEYISGGTIKDYINRHGINSSIARKAILEVLLGLKYLHSKNIIHRDIKADNILMSDNTVKIIDFGISKRIKEAKTKLYGEGEAQSELITTFEYCSPEQIDPYTFGVNDTISYGVDVWMFGVLTYYLCTGNFPFGTSGESGKTEKLRKSILSTNPNNIEWDGVPDFYKTVISKCLTKKASVRPDITEIISDFKNQEYLAKEKETEVYSDSASVPPKGKRFINWNRILYYLGVPASIAVIFIVAYSFLMEDKDNESHARLDVFESKRKYGYRTSAGEVILPAVYEKAGRFVDGEARVERNDSVFIINSNGEIVELVGEKNLTSQSSNKSPSTLEIKESIIKIVKGFNEGQSDTQRLKIIRNNEDLFKTWTTSSSLFAVNGLNESSLKSVFLKAVDSQRSIEISEIAVDEKQNKIQYALFTLVE